MVINQGEIYWIELDEPVGSSPGYRHPHVVIQNNIFNQSRINTVVVCALTSNLKRGDIMGNVKLEVGEANLPKQSVIVISQIFTVDKSQIGEYIGKLSKRRINQIVDGIKLMIEPKELD
ncbi:MAG: type II toxin-antitoxin system PemK/MazF family toxin [Desulfamplus sp.]|nr:type II toxin-antitoxin system PemK/MazF family toxin [Desulfamplus sp.]MBF0390726.1 type II toxin-antitoxin system PemK/MazF family toxin [Desulfamplus sp.]